MRVRLRQRCMRLAARQFRLASKGVFAGPTYAWAVDSIVALTKKPAREVTRASDHLARHPFYADDCTDALRNGRELSSGRGSARCHDAAPRAASDEGNVQRGA
jgi:hypothetical protein